jgi:hypothetical protein
MDRREEIAEHEMSKEEQYASLHNLVMMLPYILGFGWIAMIPLAYFFIAPGFGADDSLIRIGVTIGIAVVNLIADVVLMTIMRGNLNQLAQELESQIA